MKKISIRAGWLAHPSPRNRLPHLSRFSKGGDYTIQAQSRARVQQRQATITTGSDKVRVSAAVVTARPARHKAQRLVQCWAARM